MAMNHIVKSNWAAGLTQNSKQIRKKNPKWLIWAPQLLNLCRWCGAVPSATPPGCRGPCQPLQAPSWHSVPCPRACPVSLGQSRPSGAGWAADAQKGEQNKGSIVPCAPPGLPELTALLFPKTFLQEAVTIIHVDIQKNNSGNTRGGERGNAQQWHGHRDMRGMRRRGAARLAMAHESHWLEDDLLCAAHRWRFLTCKVLLSAPRGQQQLRSYSNRAWSQVRMNKTTWKRERQKVQKLYISEDAGQKSPEGMGVLGHIYFCFPRCHCCRGGLLTSVSMLTPSPEESNNSWLHGYQFAKTRIPWEFHHHFIGHHFWYEKELRLWLSPFLCHHHHQFFSPVPWKMWNFKTTGPQRQSCSFSA